MQLSFGATLPDGVSAGTPATSAVSITDDDVPSVTVSFGSAAYTVAESDDPDTPDLTENTVEVTVTLSADPERTVIIPIEKTNQGGASDSDYTGVPESVTFDAGETRKTFVFTAETDTDDDHGESVRLSFNTMPDARVSEGSPSEAMVTIRQDSTPSTSPTATRPSGAPTWSSDRKVHPARCGSWAVISWTASFTMAASLTGSDTAPWLPTVTIFP